MAQILLFVIDFISLVKILLPVMDLNTANKLCRIIMNARNSDFGKIAIPVKSVCVDTSRSSAS